MYLSDLMKRFGVNDFSAVHVLFGYLCNGQVLMHCSGINAKFGY